MYKPGPFIIFTLFGLVGILTTSLVPETKDVLLPERTEDVDKMVAGFRFWELRPWLRKEEEAEKKEEEEVALT